MITKRENILITAMRLFVEKGIHSTPTALIAKEAKVATGTLFHHFKTKEDLVHELYMLIFDSLIGYHKQYFKEKATVYEKLQQIWHLNIEWAMAHVEYANFLEHYTFHYYASSSVIQDATKRFDYYTAIFQEAILNNLLNFRT